MPAVEINLTTEQLATAYARMNQRERRSFLLSVLTQPTSEQITLEVLAKLQTTLRRKFSPAKQRHLDKLLDANSERELRPAEQKQLEELTAEYGEDLVEKARSRYLLELSRRADKSSR